MNKKKLFISNLAWNHCDSDKILNLLKTYNINGIDFAPMKIKNKWQGIEINLKKFLQKLNVLKFKINAIQGIFYKTNFNLIKSKKNKIYFHIKKILKISKILNCNKIIIGSSYFRDISNLLTSKADLTFVDFFKKIKPLLRKNRIYLCFETIPKNYGEKYLYNINKLVYLIKKLKSPWLKINFDTSIFHFKKFDKTDFFKNKKYIKNIQISEKNFKFFTKPSKANLLFSKLIKKNKTVKNISLEMISNKTDIKKISLSLKNFTNIFN